MSDIAVTVTNPGSAAVTVGAGGSVSATVSSGGSVAVNLPGGEAAWANITGKPTTFTPAAHTHVAADITDRATALVTSVNGQTGAVTISGGGGGASLSDATPQALGTASAGTSSSASRADHVHALPALVASLNTLTGPLTLAAGTGVTITPSGSTLTIASTATGGIGADDTVDGGEYVGVIPSNTITIVTQPTAQTASNGNANFSVVANSTPGGSLSYQWQRSTDSGATWSNVSGETSSILALSGLVLGDNGNRYRVVVSATDAVSVTSNSATLTVPAAPAGTAWLQRGSDIDGSAGDTLGFSVALSGDGSVLAASARAADSNRGRVRVFTWGGSAWSQRGADMIGEEAGEFSGQSVSMNDAGTLVAIGSPQNSASPGADTGQVRVYAWNGTSWLQRGADITVIGSSEFGDIVAVDASGDTLAIAAPSSTYAGQTSNAGMVLWAGWDGQAYATILLSSGFADGNRAGSGLAVSGDGNTLAFGLLAGGGSGELFRVNVFRRNGTTVSSPSVVNLMGYAPHSISLSANGNVMAVGVDGVSGAGRVNVYQWSGSAWTARGAAIDGLASDDNSYAVKLNSAGTSLVIGARSGDLAGTSSGYIRAYDWDGSAWVQRGATLLGEAANDFSGFAATISGDGATIAAGAYGNDGGGSNSGHVRVFRWQ